MNDRKIASARTETNTAMLKNFFRMYYSERYKTVKAVTLVAAIVLFIMAAAAYYNGYALIITVICVWLGLLLTVYPRNAYRRSYKREKNTKTVTHFDFYEDFMTERSGGKTEKFRYSELYKIIETNKYIYIYHSPETASIIEKNDISFGSADEITELLKAKTKYKRK